jgi:hypothetical protein
VECSEAQTESDTRTICANAEAQARAVSIQVPVNFAADLEILHIREFPFNCQVSSTVIQSIGCDVENSSVEHTVGLRSLLLATTLEWRTAEHVVAFTSHHLRMLFLTPTLSCLAFNNSDATADRELLLRGIPEARG